MHIYIFTYLFGQWHTKVLIWRLEDNFLEMILSFYHGVLGIELKLSGLAASPFTN